MTSLGVAELFARVASSASPLAGSSRTPLAIVDGVKISESRFASSIHFLSVPLRRTARASPSSCFRVSISALSSFDCARRRCLIEYLLFSGFDLVVRSLVKIFDIFLIESRRINHQGNRDSAASLQQLQLAKAASSRSLRRRKDW